MSLRGFSAFEARFRAKMAQSAPTDVLVKKRIKDGLTQKEIDDYKITFRKFDVDDSGTIDTQELGNLIRVLGLNPSDEEVKSLRREIDDDENGELDFKEFCQLMNSATLRKMQAVDDREARLRKALQSLENDDGRILREDIVKLVTTKGSMQLTFEEANDLCNRVRSDDEGQFRKLFPFVFSVETFFGCTLVNGIYFKAILRNGKLNLQERRFYRDFDKVI